MEDQAPSVHKTQDQWKAFANLFFNLILPTIILNKLSHYFGDKGPLIALVVALAFPLTYGIYDYLVSKKNNILAILGIINIVFTGGFALFKLEGIWFAVKEASIPFLIGFCIFLSAFTKRPLIHLLLFNETLMNVQLIRDKLTENGSETAFEKLLRNTTVLLSFSFFFSALLNFLLARHIFIDISQTVTDHQKSLILNDQIAQMTWKSYLIIALPGLIVTSAIMVYLMKGVRRLTGLDFQQVLKT